MAGALLLVVALGVDAYRFYKMMDDVQQSSYEEDVWNEEESQVADADSDLKETDEDAYDWMDELRKDSEDSEGDGSGDK